MTSNAVATQNGNSAIRNANLTGEYLDREKIQLIKDTILRGASDLELQMFVNLCETKRLDPLTRQIYGIKTGQGLQMFASIDGLRVIAERSRQYAGQVGPFWCGSDGQWTDVWLAKEPPAAAKVGVLRKGWTEPMWGVATLASYGKDSPIWRKMADIMLAKCAESVALRKAFPDDISGLYIREEFGEAETPEPPVNAPTAQHSRPERPSVQAEVVDAETGEINGFNPETATQKQIKDEIAGLRSVLGWTANDTAQFVDEQGFNIKTREGNLALIAAMQEYVDREFEQDDDLGDEDDEPAQGTLIDAETRPIDRWAEN